MKTGQPAAIRQLGYHRRRQQLCESKKWRRRKIVKEKLACGENESNQLKLWHCGNKAA